MPGAVSIFTPTPLGSGLGRGGFAQTRVNARGAMIERVRATLDADLSTFTVAAG